MRTKATLKPDYNHQPLSDEQVRWRKQLCWLICLTSFAIGFGALVSALFMAPLSVPGPWPLFLLIIASVFTFVITIEVVSSYAQLAPGELSKLADRAASYPEVEQELSNWISTGRTLLNRDATQIEIRLDMRDEQDRLARDEVTRDALGKRA